MICSLPACSFGGLWAGWPAKGSAKKSRRREEENNEINEGRKQKKGNGVNQWNEMNLLMESNVDGINK